MAFMGDPCPTNKRGIGAFGFIPVKLTLEEAIGEEIDSNPIMLPWCRSVEGGS
jgi:hypothetical protein